MNEEDTPIIAKDTQSVVEDLAFTPLAGQVPQSGVPTIPQLSVALSLLLVLLGSPYLVSLWHVVENRMAIEDDGVPAAGTDLSPNNTQADPFADVALEAKAAYVWDVSAGKALYAKEAHAQLPLASLTKLMTGLVAYETLNQDTRVKITLDAISQDGEHGLQDGDTWQMSELLGFTMMSSSNDGAYALASVAGAFTTSGGDGFIDHMNEKARELGLAQTYFTNPTGLDAKNMVESGGYGSARDMAFLMEYIIKHTPAVVAHTTKPAAVFTDEGGEAHTATNTNQSIGMVANALASKTGYTELAGGNLVVAFDAGLNHPVIIAVLHSSREGRFSDVELLLERTKQALTLTP